MPLPLSQRAVHMPASPIRRLAPYAVAARKRGLAVYGLNIGQPDIATPQVSVVASTLGGHSADIPQYPYDVQKAKALLLRTVVGFIVILLSLALVRFVIEPAVA